MAELLKITDTRKSPFTLADIGYRDGDLTTLTALAESLARTDGLLAESYVPVKWIEEYADNAAPEAAAVIRSMLETRREVL